MTNQAYDMNDLAEMLAGRALGDLTDAEGVELDRLNIAHGDSDEFDLLAARLDLALTGGAPPEPVPASLTRALENAAERFIDDQGDGAGAVPEPAAEPARPSLSPPSAGSPPRPACSSPPSPGSRRRASWARPPSAKSPLAPPP